MQDEKTTRDGRRRRDEKRKQGEKRTADGEKNRKLIDGHKWIGRTSRISRISMVAIGSRQKWRQCGEGYSST